MSLSKDQIFAAEDTGLLKVHVPEWNGDVYIRVMSVGERDAYENEWQRKKDTGVDDFRTKFLVRCLVDENGVRLFDNGDVAKLATKSARVMNRLWMAAMEHNSLSDTSIEELAKNSDPGPQAGHS
ncbi:MAG: hypothetical protein EBR82_85325 [Caulobacteraceae bacterium]|nr:hypothetical protein [Caulobacteraceae bacterium]